MFANVRLRLLFGIRNMFFFVFVLFWCHLSSFVNVNVRPNYNVNLNVNINVRPNDNVNLNVNVNVHPNDNVNLNVNVNVRPNLDVWTNERSSTFDNEDTSNI